MIEDITRPTHKNNTWLIKVLIFVISLLVIVLCVLGYVIYNNFIKKRPVKTDSSATSTEKIVQKKITTEEKKEIFEEKKGWYETKIEYPKDSKIVKDLMLSNYKNYLEETGVKNFKTDSEARKALLLSDDTKYSFDAEYTTSTSTFKGKNTKTYTYSVYTFTGGAHGLTNVITYTISDGKLLSEKEILNDEDLKNISSMAYKQIMEEKKKRWTDAGLTDKEIKQAMLSEDTVELVKEGTKPIRENYTDLILDGNNLIINFDQYQVGAYAEGSYQVKIPLSALK